MSQYLVKRKIIKRQNKLKITTKKLLKSFNCRSRPKNKIISQIIQKLKQTFQRVHKKDQKPLISLKKKLNKRKKISKKPSISQMISRKRKRKTRVLKKKNKKSRKNKQKKVKASHLKIRLLLKSSFNFYDLWYIHFCVNFFYFNICL